MLRQLNAAHDGDQDALQILAAGWKPLFDKGELSVTARFEDGLDAAEYNVLMDALETYRAGQRKSWRLAKDELDSKLISMGWDQAEKARPVKEAEFNQVLMDWTTQGQVISKGFALMQDRIVNTRDALYAQPANPGAGAYHAALSNWAGRVVPKRWSNWLVMWVATMAIMATLSFWTAFRLPGRPRQT